MTIACPLAVAAAPLSHDIASQLNPPLSPFLLAQVRKCQERELAWRGRFIFEGRPTLPTDIRLDGNDYLHLTGSPHILNAQAAALSRQANGASAVVQSGAILNSAHPVRALEKRLAQYVGKEDVHLSQSGYAANLTLLQGVCRPEQPVYIDMLAHMSLWEGVNAARATPTPFRHNDASSLRKAVAKGGPGVVIVDSVYSSNGALCPLTEILEVCEEAGCTLVVDESHSLGLYGERGAGLVAALGLTSRIHFITASLAKAFAARAGMFTAPACLRTFIYSGSYPSVFSSCLLPVDVAGLDATLDLVIESDARRARLHQVGKRLRDILRQAGFPVETGTEQIVALEAGEEYQTMLLRDAFERHGVIGAIFCAPASGLKRSFLRLTPHSGISDDDLARVAEAAMAVAGEIRPWEWASARRQSSQTPGPRSS